MSQNTKYVKSIIILTMLLLLLTNRNYLFSLSTNQDIIEAILPSIVIIDSERITYNSPYEVLDISNLFFPLNLNTDTTNLQGDGISRKEIFGSGIFIKKSHKKYYLLTNNHVVEDSTNIWITTYDGLIHSATLEGGDEQRDLAVVSITTDIEYPLITTITNPVVSTGTPVYVIGSPYGFTFSVSKGIISSSNRTDSTLQNIFFQTDATMNPGNSGGALINEKGELIGISTWIYSPKTSTSIGLNFASSIDIALEIAEQIINDVPIEYGWIGIVYHSFSPSELSNMNVDYRFGSIITGIVDESPAEKAKLQIGDIIVAINEQKVHAFNSTLNNTTALISTLGTDKIIDLTIYRNNQRIKISTTTIGVPVFEEKIISSDSTSFHNIATLIKPGMVVIPLEAYKKELLGLKDSQYALLVSETIADSPADSTGIKADDIILTVNGTQLKNYQHYLDTINEAILQNKDIRLELYQSGEYIEKTLNFKQFKRKK